MDAGNSQRPPLVAHDGAEYWLVYEGDNVYAYVEALDPDERGVRHIKPELVEQLSGWNWRQAVEKAEKAIAELAIPWAQLECSGPEIAAGDLTAYSEKLAKTSHFIVRVNLILTTLVTRQISAREQLEHAVALKLERQETYGMEAMFLPAAKAGGEEPPKGRKPAQALRAAATISKDKRLRNMKIEVMETAAAIKALEITKEALDLLWRTTSRLMSARMAEPID